MAINGIQKANKWDKMTLHFTNKWRDANKNSETSYDYQIGKD